MSIRDGAQFDPRVIVELFRDDGFGVQIGDDNPENIIQPCIRFDLPRDRLGEANAGIIELHNLSEDMKARIRLGEFKKVLVRAGFLRANNIANIWEGKIRKATPKEVGKYGDRAIIYTAEGDVLFQRQTINKTWPAGTSPVEMVRYVLNRTDGIGEGDLSGLEGREGNRRPYTATGSVREFFDDLMRTYDARWSVQRSVLDFIGNGTFSKAFKVSRKTLETGLYDADLDEAAAYGQIALDPAIEANGAIEIFHSEKPSVNGFWRVNRARHHGSVGGGQDCIFTDFIAEKLEGVNVITNGQERISLRA